MRRRSPKPSCVQRLEERRLLSLVFDGSEREALEFMRARQGPSPLYTPPAAELQSVVGGSAANGRQPAGALSGKIVFTHGGHGFTANTSTWNTQRGEYNEIVEDLGNQDQMTMFVNYLFNAGATVVPLRPVGHQTNEVVVDNDDPGVTYTGSWTNSTSTVFYGSAGDIEFGEINNLYINNEFDATIVEVGYHDNVQDAADLRDPKVRDATARATTEAAIKYFRQFNSEPSLALPPDAPTNVRAISQADGDVTVSWNAPVVDGIGGDAASGYVVYSSNN